MNIVDMQREHRNRLIAEIVDLLQNASIIEVDIIHRIVTRYLRK